MSHDPASGEPAFAPPFPPPTALPVAPPGGWTPGPSPGPSPASRGVAPVVWSTVLLAPLWGLTWIGVNWSLGYCVEQFDPPDTSVTTQQLVLGVATLVWTAPALVGVVWARRRGVRSQWQRWLAGSIAALGALAAWRLGPVELCIS